MWLRFRCPSASERAAVSGRAGKKKRGGAAEPEPPCKQVALGLACLLCLLLLLLLLPPAGRRLLRAGLPVCPFLPVKGPESNARGADQPGRAGALGEAIPAQRGKSNRAIRGAAARSGRAGRTAAPSPPIGCITTQVGVAFSQPSRDSPPAGLANWALGERRKPRGFGRSLSRSCVRNASGPNPTG